MMNCKQCGADNDESAKFCVKCGNELLKENSCSKCGKTLKRDAEFCVECGTKIVLPESESSRPLKGVVNNYKRNEPDESGSYSLGVRDLSAKGNTKSYQKTSGIMKFMKIIGYCFLIFIGLFIGLSAYDRYEAKRDLEKDFVETKIRAEAGNAVDQFNLAVKYDNGRGVPKNAAKAVEWFQKAAVQGDADAQIQLGHIYNSTYGQNRDIPNDDAKALEWYQKAAAQGNATAQYHLGMMYFRIGALKDDVKAVEWFQKADAQGNRQAQDILDSMNDHPDVLKKAATQALWERFERLVDKAKDYQAALVMRELCHRGYYSNIREQGALGLNCKLVLSVDPKDVTFDQGGRSGPMDFKGMAILK